MIGRPVDPGTPPPAGYQWVRLAPSHLVHIADERNLTVSLCDVPVEAAVDALPASGGELCEWCRRSCPETYRR